MSSLVRIFLVAFVLVLALSACGSNTSEAESKETAQEIVEETDEAVENEGVQPEAEGAAHSMPMDMEEVEHAMDDHTEVDGHSEDDEHAADEHAEGGEMAAMHTVPAEAATVENPLPTSAESIAVGAEIYVQSCAVCHGDEGKGNGPGGVALDPKPADLTVEHVQANTDGALFYIISHGVEETGMPAWKEQLSEEQRWSVVNFVRTLD